MDNIINPIVELFLLEKQSVNRLRSKRMAVVEARQARTLDTRSRLMRAMEKLSAEKGSENVSVKELTEEAGQKNESVLQYHFGSKAVCWLRFTRPDSSKQVKRREMLADYLARVPLHLCRISAI